MYEHLSFSLLLFLSCVSTTLDAENASQALSRKIPNLFIRFGLDTRKFPGINLLLKLWREQQGTVQVWYKEIVALNSYLKLSPSKDMLP